MYGNYSTMYMYMYMYMNNQSLRQGKAKQLYLKTTLFSQEKKKSCLRWDSTCTCTWVYSVIVTMLIMQYIIVHVHVCVRVNYHKL